MSVNAIQKELLGLSAKERVQLIDVLWKSISGPQQQVRESAWAEESERRIDAFNDGKLAAREATDVFDDLKKSLRR